MADDTTVTPIQNGTSIVTTQEPTECIGIKEYILYKLDRTIAVIGLIIIAMWVCWLRQPEGMQIVNTAVGGLIGYICGRGAAK
jgi:hypothetical protein